MESPDELRSCIGTMNRIPSPGLKATLPPSDGERIPPNRISRFEPLNLEGKWSKIAILRKMLRYRWLRRSTLERFMGWEGVRGGSWRVFISSWPFVN